MWYQKTLTLSAKSRGFHLVTDEILNQLADMPRVNIGLLHLLLQHMMRRAINALYLVR